MYDMVACERKLVKSCDIDSLFSQDPQSSSVGRVFQTVGHKARPWPVCVQDGYPFVSITYTDHPPPKSVR